MEILTNLYSACSIITLPVSDHNKTQEALKFIETFEATIIAPETLVMLIDQTSFNDDKIQSYVCSIIVHKLKTYILIEQNRIDVWEPIVSKFLALITRDSPLDPFLLNSVANLIASSTKIFFLNFQNEKAFSLINFLIQNIKNPSHEHIRINCCLALTHIFERMNCKIHNEVYKQSIRRHVESASEFQELAIPVIFGEVLHTFNRLEDSISIETSPSSKTFHHVANLVLECFSWTYDRNQHFFEIMYNEEFEDSIKMNISIPAHIYYLLSHSNFIEKALNILKLFHADKILASTIFSLIRRIVLKYHLINTESCAFNFTELEVLYQILKHLTISMSSLPQNEFIAWNISNILLLLVTHHHEIYKLLLSTEDYPVMNVIAEFTIISIRNAIFQENMRNEEMSYLGACNHALSFWAGLIAYKNELTESVETSNQSTGPKSLENYLHAVCLKFYEEYLNCRLVVQSDGIISPTVTPQMLNFMLESLACCSEKTMISMSDLSLISSYSYDNSIKSLSDRLSLILHKFNNCEVHERNAFIHDICWIISICKNLLFDESEPTCIFLSSATLNVLTPDVSTTPANINIARKFVSHLTNLVTDSSSRISLSDLVTQTQNMPSGTFKIMIQLMFLPLVVLSNLQMYIVQCAANNEIQSRINFLLLDSCMEIFKPVIASFYYSDSRILMHPTFTTVFLCKKEDPSIEYIVRFLHNKLIELAIANPLSILSQNSCEILLFIHDRIWTSFSRGKNKKNLSPIAQSISQIFIASVPNLLSRSTSNDPHNIVQFISSIAYRYRYNDSSIQKFIQDSLSSFEEDCALFFHTALNDIDESRYKNMSSTLSKINAWTLWRQKNHQLYISDHTMMLSYSHFEPVFKHLILLISFDTKHQQILHLVFRVLKNLAMNINNHLIDDHISWTDDFNVHNESHSEYIILYFIATMTFCVEYTNRFEKLFSNEWGKTILDWHLLIDCFFPNIFLFCDILEVFCMNQRSFNENLLLILYQSFSSLVNSLKLMIQYLHPSLKNRLYSISTSLISNIPKSRVFVDKNLPIFNGIQSLLVFPELAPADVSIEWLRTVKTLCQYFIKIRDSGLWLSPIDEQLRYIQELISCKILFIRLPQEIVKDLSYVIGILSNAIFEPEISLSVINQMVKIVSSHENGDIADLKSKFPSIFSRYQSAESQNHNSSREIDFSEILGLLTMHYSFIFNI